MNELDTMERARMYLSKLANGVDPIEGTELPEDSVLNNVRLSRCFFYVADVLRQVIEQGGVAPPRKAKLGEFFLTDEQRQHIEASEEPIPVSKLLARINEAADLMNVKKLPSTAVTGWLMSCGFLHEVQIGSRRSKEPTQQGGLIGLSLEERTGQHGEYKVVLYNKTAQQFVIDSLPAVLEFRREQKTPEDQDSQ